MEVVLSLNDVMTDVKSMIKAVRREDSFAAIVISCKIKAFFPTLMNATKDVLRAFPQHPMDYTLSRAVIESVSDSDSDSDALLEYTFHLKYAWPASLPADAEIEVDFDDEDADAMQTEIVLWLKAIFATTVLRITTPHKDAAHAIFPSATPYVL